MKLSKEFIEMFRQEAKKAQWEINCWNGKGIDDLVVDYLERKELKPKDITGVVVLNLDQAKALLKRVPMFEMSAEWMHPIEVLQAKIEQAEKGDGQ